MQFLIDDPNIEKQFQQLQNEIKLRKNGPVSDSMKEKGIKYAFNWGVSIMDLKEIARKYPANHLLALKLWNKQWRESMILATMLDDPKQVTEEQMDFWTKSFENTEIAEHAVANLWVKTPFAFVKAIEWMRGKKHLVRYTGIQLMGRLAMVEKKALDEMFEPFFEVLYPLTKDASLSTVLYRSLNILGSRSKHLNGLCLNFVSDLKESDSEAAKKLAGLVYEELSSDFIQERFDQ